MIGFWGNLRPRISMRLGKKGKCRLNLFIYGNSVFYMKTRPKYSSLSTPKTLLVSPIPIPRSSLSTSFKRGSKKSMDPANNDASKSANKL